MGEGWTPLRWLLQPFTRGLETSTACSPSSARSSNRVTQALGSKQTPIKLDAITQSAVDAFIARLIADYEAAPFAIETALEPATTGTDQRQMILLYPKGLRRDGQTRRCEELTVAVVPAGATHLTRQHVEAVAHAMLRHIEQRLRQDAIWVDAELEAGLKLGFPADWRDYRFVG